jgi:hypothetical protein
MRAFPIYRPSTRRTAHPPTRADVTGPAEILLIFLFMLRFSFLPDFAVFVEFLKAFFRSL